MTPLEITEWLKMITTIAMLLRSKGVTKETIDARLAQEWALADQLHKQNNE